MTTSQSRSLVESRSSMIESVSRLKSTPLTRLPQRFWNLARLSIAFLTRIGWHTRAYGTILGILLLTLISLIVLQTYEFCRFALGQLQKSRAIASDHDFTQ